MEELKHKELTYKIIQVFYSVYNELGFGFLEKVYQNALYFELQMTEKIKHTDDTDLLLTYLRKSV